VEEGMALLEKAAGQGHAYAMNALAGIHHVRKEYELALQWYLKGAETGLPVAMFNFGFALDAGDITTPDYLAAAGWYRRAGEAGHDVAANNLSHMYAVGRGRVRQIMPADF
jgi:hypothetical protein